MLHVSIQVLIILSHSQTNTTNYAKFIAINHANNQTNYAKFIATNHANNQTKNMKRENGS